MYEYNKDAPQPHHSTEPNGLRNGTGNGESQPSRQPMPHIDDLKTKAQARIDQYAPVGLQDLNHNPYHSHVLLDTATLTDSRPLGEAG